MAKKKRKTQKIEIENEYTPYSPRTLDTLLDLERLIYHKINENNSNHIFDKVYNLILQSLEQTLVAVDYCRNPENIPSYYEGKIEAEKTKIHYKITQPLIYIFSKLHTYIDEIDDYIFEKHAYYDDFWPKRPKATAFLAIQHSALEACLEFVREFRYIYIDKCSAVFGSKLSDNVHIYPKPDPRILKIK